MTIELHSVSKSEFPAVWRSVWDAFENPPQNLFYIFAPINEDGVINREDAIRKGTIRFWEWTEADPRMSWQQAIDSKTGKIVGGALWILNETNPYAEPAPEEEAYWHPAGGQRDYANQVMEKYEETRARLARRPHMYLNIIWVHPEHRRQGVGRKIMDWGIAKAAEMNVEIWLNAWVDGRALYESCGFTVVSHYKIEPRSEKPDEAFENCQREWTGMEEWVMWRPKDGPYVEGKSIKPWEE